VAFKVKTLIPGIRLPDGSYYPEANTEVFVTEDVYVQINRAMYSRGWLADLGAAGDDTARAASVAVALALVLGGR